MAKKKSTPKSGKRRADGKAGDLSVIRARGAAVKGGALTTAPSRVVAAPNAAPNAARNTLSKSTDTYLG